MKTFQTPITNFLTIKAITVTSVSYFYKATFIEQISCSLFRIE